MSKLKAAIIGCGRMGTTIDDEVVNHPFTGGLPYSHAACYAAIDDIEMVACSDVLEEKVRATQDRYGIPDGYTDYREMIEKSKPDIVSVTTRPNNHAEIVEFAAEHGVRGIYCEKPLCCSMEEAARMIAACEKNHVKFNLGTNRRYTNCHNLMRKLIEDGEIGEMRALIMIARGSAQWSLTHASDLILFMAGDPEVEYVQGTVAAEAADFKNDHLDKDPAVLSGFVKFTNHVTAHLVSAPGWDIEAVGNKGRIRTVSDKASLQILRAMGPANMLCEVAPPPFRHDNGGVNCILDIIAAMREDRETKGNIRLAARSQEIILGWVESHRRGGIPLALPMENRSLYVGKY